MMMAMTSTRVPPMRQKKSRRPCKIGAKTRADSTYHWIFQPLSKEVTIKLRQMRPEVTIKLQQTRPLSLKVTIKLQQTRPEVTIKLQHTEPPTLKVRMKQLQLLMLAA